MLLDRLKLFRVCIYIYIYTMLVVTGQIQAFQSVYMYHASCYWTDSSFSESLCVCVYTYIYHASCYWTDSSFSECVYTMLVVTRQIQAFQSVYIPC